MTALGLGNDGYLRIQKETTFGTGVTSSMTLLPILFDANIKAAEEMIENDNVIGNRLTQDPDAGQIKVGGSDMISLHGHPALLGLLFNLLLGTSSDGTVTDSTYEHTWFVPITGERVGKSFTCQQARGSGLAEQYTGGIIHKMTISGDNKGNVTFKFGVIFQNYTEGVTRITSFSYPSISPYNFSHFSVTLDPVSPTNDALFTQLCEGFELDLDLKYDLERFKLGARYVQQAVFNDKPSLTLKLLGCDAEQVFATYARARNTFAIALQILHASYAGGTTPYRTQFEIPKARLKAETVPPNAKGRLKQDLEFNCGYGGPTTGSSGNQIMEIRHRDATAAYA